MQDIYLYNTASRKKERFEPRERGKVGMYTCGPTVYGYQHIGNYSAFVMADLLRRYLEHCGYEVRHIQNITDVGHLTDDDIGQGDAGEDKLLKQAQKEKKTPWEIAAYYTDYHEQTSRALNIQEPQMAPRATEHIPHMIILIEKLIENGHAYEASGNVFLDVTAFEDYGKLSGNKLKDLSVGARFSEPHPDKKNQWDFALWLKAAPEHIMKWDAPWSVGYPGWHIECSAMSMEYLGEQFDIHTGGEDHIFPHHEAEIAQSEGATNAAPFAKHWVHKRHMLIDGTKMSKSKGNLYTLEDIIAKGYSAMDLRMMYTQAHYRTQMNFTWNALSQAQKNLQTLSRFVARLQNATAGEIEFNIADYQKQFESALADDLNTPQALTVLLEVATEGNKILDASGIANKEKLERFLQSVVTDVLGVDLVNTEAVDAPKDVCALADERQKARVQKDWKRSDELREEIAKKGYTVEDTKDCYTLTKN